MSDAAHIRQARVTGQRALGSCMVSPREIAFRTRRENLKIRSKLSPTLSRARPDSPPPMPRSPPNPHLRVALQQLAENGQPPAQALAVEGGVRLGQSQGE